MTEDSDLENLEFEELGLRCGLEIHQQLDTDKLFCNCPSKLVEEDPDLVVERKMKAVAGEMGEVDVAATTEEMKGLSFLYHFNDESSCLVELDEEPPREMDEEALEVASKISLMLNMELVDEVQVMRKTVVDGSNTAGFQRTALLAEDGHVQISSGKVRISSLCLEEDSARKVDESDRRVIFKLDRLGVPLVELRTEPDMETPQQVKEAARKIGLVMRMTQVKRGIGTIRQDVNVSIEDGERCEIKGFQNLSDIPKIVEFEVRRQKNLIELAEKLDKRSAGAGEEIHDISDIFEDTDSKVISDALDEGGVVKVVKLGGFDGLLNWEIQPGKRLAEDLNDYVKRLTDLGGIIHSDELPSYGINTRDIENIEDKLGCLNLDGFVLTFGPEKKVERGLEIVRKRISQYLDGPTREVRYAQDDNTSKFLRPISSSARMYPETDHPPIPIDSDWIGGIDVPEDPQDKVEKYKGYDLSDDLANQVIRSKHFELFESIVESKDNLDPTHVASVLLGYESEIGDRYEGDSAKVTTDHLEKVFGALNEGKISKDAVMKLLANLSRNPENSIGEAMDELGVEKMGEDELEEVIDKVLSGNETLRENKEFKILMGLVMRKVRGRIDGEKVANKLKEKLGMD